MINCWGIWNNKLALYQHLGIEHWRYEYFKLKTYFSTHWNVKYYPFLRERWGWCFHSVLLGGPNPRRGFHFRWRIWTGGGGSKSKGVLICSGTGTPVINPRRRQSRWRRHTIVGDAQQIERGARRLGKGRREAPVRSETFAFLHLGRAEQQQHWRHPQ